MSEASARRSFHGPLISKLPSPSSWRPSLPAPKERTPSPHHLGAALRAARHELASPSQRELVLAGVLSALQRLTAEHG
jgi:hypothetical protein